MKPVAFDYARPRDIAEAVGMLAHAGDGYPKIVSGGQSLGPMLNLRLVQPTLLIDISRLPETTGSTEDASGVTYGAATTHAMIEDGKVPDPTGGVLPRVARGIAYRAVRNRGTVGGSLAHADPAADWVTTMTALGAQVVIAGEMGERTVDMSEFMIGAFETVLGPTDLLRAVRVPRLSGEARWGYYKICRKTGEFAKAMAAVLVDRPRGVCRLVVGATSGRPIVLDDAHGVIDGGTKAIAEFIARAAPTLDEVDRRLQVAAVSRAIKANQERRTAA